MSGVVGKRYARALLGIAEETKKIEAFGNELGVLADTYKGSAELRSVLADPKINREKKIEIIGSIASKLKLEKVMNNFSRLLVSKNRIDVISDIFLVYQEMASDLLGTGVAEVTVASELSKSKEKELQKELSGYTGKKISLLVNVDPTLIGGAITRIGSLVLDGSIKNQVNLIRETIIKG